MAHLKPMLKVWGSPCYLDLTSKLAVLWLDGIERDNVEHHCEYLEDMIVTFLKKTDPHLELPTHECRVLEVFKTTSLLLSFALVLTSTPPCYLHLAAEMPREHCSTACKQFFQN